MVYKRPPYYPAKVGFGADDATFLADHGFNAIRLGVIYKGVEPRPPSGGKRSYNDAYLAQIAKTQKTLASKGVFSQIDFHQDLFHERFQGEGWPDWQVQDDGLPNPRNGFPNNYLTNPALNRAFDHFWANDLVGGVKLQDEYAAAWKHVARTFRDSNRVLGYDVMNEPWPGSGWQTCAQPAGCPQFDQGPLATMTRKTTAAIRSVDSRHIVWHEPNVIFNFGSQSHLPEIGSNSGFSFHDYCLNPGAPDCPTTEALVFQNADDEAAQTNRALLLSEFGATDDLAEINRIANLADAPHGLVARVALLRLQRSDHNGAGRRAGPGQGPEQATPRHERQVQEAEDPRPGLPPGRCWDARAIPVPPEHRRLRPPLLDRGTCRVPAGALRQNRRLPPAHSLPGRLPSTGHGCTRRLGSRFAAAGAGAFPGRHRGSPGSLAEGRTGASE